MEGYNPKTGDVVLVHNPFNLLKPGTYLPVAIRLIDKTYYNHAKLVVKGVGEVYYINEALAGGIRSSNLEHNLKGKKIIVLRPKKQFLSIKEEIEFIIKANSYVGVSKYDFDGTLFRQAVYQTTGYWVKGKEDQSTEEFYCSDYPAYLMNMYEWWKVSPRQLLKSDEFNIIWQN